MVDAYYQAHISSLPFKRRRFQVAEGLKEALAVLKSYEKSRFRPPFGALLEDVKRHVAILSRPGGSERDSKELQTCDIRDLVADIY